jgi:plastocyanin
MVPYDRGALTHKNIITMYRYFRAGSRNVSRLSRFVRMLFLAAVGLGIFAFTNSRIVEAADVPVNVGPGTFFDPQVVNINPGDTVVWTWVGGMSHSVTEGTPGNPTGFDSGIHDAGFTFSVTFSDPGTVDYFCTPHGALMLGTINVAGGTPTPTPTPTPTLTPTPTPTPSPTPTPTPPAQSLNVSTRLEVGTGDKVSIGGIIITEGEPKRVLLRAIGPSLASFGVIDPLADPVLELHAGDGTLITSNDNWNSPPAPDIEATGLAPTNPLESAIIATLDPGLYTAVVTGKDGGTGVGLVEAYDLDQSATSQLGNLSTRGFVETGDKLMIGGFILGPDEAQNANVLVRAIGPSLTAFGVTDALADPVLELHDANGTLITSNDNWNSPPAPDIEATGLAPTNSLESAILMNLAPGGYTAVVAGNGGSTGVALVEVYRLP